MNDINKSTKHTLVTLGGLMNSRQMTFGKTLGEVLHFRILFATLFIWFLVLALIHRIKMTRKNELNLWDDAKRNASSIAPYAFMRI